MELKIKDIIPRQILDQNGNPTVEVELILSDNSRHFASVPVMPATSQFVEIRDKNVKDKFNGKGVIQALVNIDIMITPNLVGIDPCKQQKIDNIIKEVGLTKDLGAVGANSALAVSIAVLKAGAYAQGVPVYAYLTHLLKTDYSVTFAPNLAFPTPVIILIEGGKDNINNLAINELGIIPFGIKDIREKIRAGSEITHKLKELLKKNNFEAGTGNNGGFVPNLENDQVALELITEAIKQCNYDHKNEVGIYVNPSMSDYYIKERQLYTFPHQEINGKTIAVEGQSQELLEYYINLVSQNPITAIQNAFDKEDWKGYSSLNPLMESQSKFCITEDLINNDDELIEKVVRTGGTNMISLSLQGSGLVSNLLNNIDVCKKNNLKIMISDNTTSTSDVISSHLAIGTQAELIKVGSLYNSYGIDKLNEFMRMITPEMAKKILKMDQ